MIQSLSTKFLGTAATLLLLAGVTACDQQTAQVPANAPTTQTSPGATIAPNTTTTAPTTAASTTDVVSVVANNPSLSTLATAITDTGLGTNLQSGGPFTIFAPSDQAFAALPEATRQELLQPENRDDLRELLSYHVVQGELRSNQLSSSQVPSLEGTPLNVDVNQANSQVRINNATVTQADIPAANGVIHIIDQVILPPNVSMR
jgi:uncharacterized surface protein with fasciclin (FAS1) repeats